MELEDVWGRRDRWGSPRYSSLYPPANVRLMRRPHSRAPPHQASRSACLLPVWRSLIPPDTGVTPGVNPWARSAEQGEMNFPAHVAQAWWGRGLPSPHSALGETAPQAVGPPNTIPSAQAGFLREWSWGMVKGRPWSGTTPTKAVPNDRRTLIPWRRAGVVSGSCSRSLRGARLGLQMARRHKPVATSVRAADSAPPSLLPPQWLGPPESKMADRGGVPGQAKLRLVKRRSFVLKDGLSSQSGNSLWCRWALSRLASRLSNQGLINLVSRSLEGPRWKQGTPRWSSRQVLTRLGPLSR